jgi:hypothetical protein
VKVRKRNNEIVISGIRNEKDCNNIANDSLTSEIHAVSKEILVDLNASRSLMSECVKWYNSQIASLGAILDEKLDMDTEEGKHEMSLWSLMYQELNMWCKISEVVDVAEMNDLCTMRGFTDDMKEFLIDGLTHVGLWRS